MERKWPRSITGVALHPIPITRWRQAGRPSSHAQAM